MTRYYLYHICRSSDEGDYSKGYVGITNNPEERWKRHRSGYSGSQRLYRAYCKYDDIVESVILEGPREVCAYYEATLRPSPKIGWNIAEGGGLPPNLSGKVMSEEQKAKIGKSNSGKNNIKWKGYWVVDGVKYESMTIAAKAVGCCKKTIRDRTLSEDFPNYIFENNKYSKDPTFRQ